MSEPDYSVQLRHPLTVAFAADTVAALRSSLQPGRHATLTLHSAEVDLCGLQILLAAARSAAATGGSLGLPTPCRPEMQAKLAGSALLDHAAAPGPFRFIEEDHP